MSKLRIPQATSAGYIEVEEWGVFDFSYPESKTRRGRVQEGGGDMPNYHLLWRDTEVRTAIIYKHHINKSTSIMNKEQMTQEQRAQLIEKLRAEYNELNGKIARLNAFLCDIDFVKKVPDPIEKELMSMQFRSMKGYLDNLRGRIMFQEAQQLMEENARKQLDEWKKMKGKVVNTLCGPVRLVNTDKATKEQVDEMLHHCGQDASCQVGDGNAVVKSAEHLKPYLGWEVISVGDMPCDGCPAEHYGAQCVKLELIDRSYICLAPQPNSIVTE